MKYFGFIFLLTMLQYELCAQPQKIIDRKDTSVFIQMGYEINAFGYNGKMGLIDTLGNVVLPASYTRISMVFSNGFRIYSNNNKKGFLTENGEVLIEAIYDDIGFMSTGYAAVKNVKKWTVIDLKSRKQVCKWYEMIGCVSNGFFSVRENNKWGIINKSGEIIAPFKFQKTSCFTDDGLASIKINNRYGFIDTTGKIIIEPIYSNVLYFKEGICPVKKHGKWGYIDKTGSEFLPFIYADADAFSEGIAPVKKNGKYGFIDEKGEVVIPFIYKKAYSFSDGYRNTSVRKGLFKWYYINRKGEIVN